VQALLTELSPIDPSLWKQAFDFAWQLFFPILALFIVHDSFPWQLSSLISAVLSLQASSPKQLLGPITALSEP